MKSLKPREKTILVMPERMSRQAAMQDKIDKLSVKLFGFTLGKFEVGEIRDVYVPYGLLTYDFLIERKSMFNKDGSLNKSGELDFIFDYNEVHPFQYDKADNGELKLLKVDPAESGRVILPCNVTDQEVQEKMEWHIQTRVLRRLYGINGKTSLIAKRMFYRAAVEMKIYYGMNEHIRYAYLDGYGIDSEHILGLKYRIG